MAFLEWCDELSTGVGEMDRQHMRLVELLNRLHDATQKGKGEAVKKEVLTALVAYIQVHFTAEERMLEEHGYPQLAAHQATHEQMMSEVAELNERIGAGRMVASVNLGGFLKDWLIRHIAQEDRQYGQFIGAVAC